MHHLLPPTATSGRARQRFINCGRRRRPGDISMNKLFLCALAVTLITCSAVAGPVQVPSVAAAPPASVTSSTVAVSTNPLPGDGALSPTCLPSTNCANDSQQLIAGQGAPMPTCYPGKNCDPNQQQVIAGQGAPMPTCYPGKNCGDDSQQQIIAGQGAPMPTCYP